MSAAYSDVYICGQCHYLFFSSPFALPTHSFTYGNDLLGGQELNPQKIYRFRNVVVPRFKNILERISPLSSGSTGRAKFVDFKPTRRNSKTFPLCCLMLAARRQYPPVQQQNRVITSRSALDPLSTRREHYSHFFFQIRIT